MTTPRRDEVDAAIATVERDILDRINVDFEDSVLLVCRVLGHRADATGARIDHVHAGGMRGTVTDAEGEHPIDLDFSEPVTDPIDLTDQFLELVLRARAESGEEGMTSFEREMAESAAYRTFLTQVLAVEDVHPHLRRITFGGGDLATFAPVGPDSFLYVLLPPEGRTTLTIDQSFTWAAYADMGDAERPGGGYYTVRRWDPEAHELEMLFVLHDPAGPATTWAARAEPGDPVGLWGPRTAFHRPPATERYLLVADETGLPAVASILDALADDVPVQVLAEVADEAERHELATRPSVSVTWLHRDGAEAGTTTLLADAVDSLERPGSGTYVWGGGESRSMTAVRKIVRHRWELPRESVSLLAYWRHANSQTGVAGGEISP